MSSAGKRPVRFLLAVACDSYVSSVHCVGYHVITWLKWCVMLCAATFYGASVLYLHHDESMSRLHLRLDFLTGRHGPLLSAVGSVDYLYVDLSPSGRVVVSVDLGAGGVTVASPPGVSSVADRRWHSVVVSLRPSDQGLQTSGFTLPYLTCGADG